MSKTLTKTLTVDDLAAIKPGDIFASGTLIDSPEGLHMTGSGRMLRWVAVRGHGLDDWAIYCHFATAARWYIRDHGDKVHRPDHITLCVPCTNDALARYRP